MYPQNNSYITEEMLKDKSRGYNIFGKEISYNRAKNLLIIKRQIEENPRDASETHIKLLKKYEWAIGSLNIAKEEKEPYTTSYVFRWKTKVV